jgi:hypothetical protein
VLRFLLTIKHRCPERFYAHMLSAGTHRWPQLYCRLCLAGINTTWESHPQTFPQTHP